MFKKKKDPILADLKPSWWTSLVVQWLRLRAPNAGDTGSILGQGISKCRATWPTKQNKTKQNKKPSWLAW